MSNWEVPTDRTLLELDDAAWDELLAALDRPFVHKPRLAKLLAEPSIFDRRTEP